MSALQTSKNQVLDAIRGRRTIRKMAADRPVTREQVEEILDAASWAPTHHVTEPWRFVVMAGEERAKLGQALANAMAAAAPAGSAVSEEKLNIERAKPLTAPVVVAVISSPKQGDHIVPQEEIVAGGAALENVLLAAQSLGLGSMIRTGKHAYSAPVSEFLGMTPSESLIGFVYLGYAEGPLPPGKRTGIDGKVAWRGM